MKCQAIAPSIVHVIWNARTINKRGGQVALTIRTKASSATIEPPAQPYWAGASIDRFDNGSIRHLREKTFTGVTSTVAELRLNGETCQDICVDFARLAVCLEERGGRMEARTVKTRPAIKRFDTTHQMVYTPAGMPVWAYSDSTQYNMYAKFSIDIATVVPLIGDDVDVRQLLEPRLMFFDERVLMLVRLLVMECSDSTQTDLLYADSLSVALLLRLCSLGKAEELSQRKALAPQRLRLAQEYMRTDLSTNVRLEDVAALLGISPAHFSRAFKQCTGLSPHQWRLNERLEQARRLLVDSQHTIAQIAVSSGFSDQAHFTRVFKRCYGVTPAAWKREAR